MVRQRRVDTAPEMALRRALHQRGLRYRLHRRPLADLRRTADVVFPSARVAVEVRGCYWHACPKHATASGPNEEWWHAKFARTRVRDAETERLWRAQGWSVIVVWEHDDPQESADLIARIVQRRRPRQGGKAEPSAS